MTMSDPKDTRASQLDTVPHHVPEEETEPYEPNEDLKKYIAERTKINPNFPQLMLEAANELRKEMAEEKYRKRQQEVASLKALAEPLVEKAKELGVQVKISSQGVLIRDSKSWTAQPEPLFVEFLNEV